MSSPVIRPHNFLNTNSPDINLDRDIIDNELILGMETGQLSSKELNIKEPNAVGLAATSRFRINLYTIFISALIFLAILAWVDFIQTTFYTWLSPNSTDSIDSTVTTEMKLWYAILITFLVIGLVVLIYWYLNKIDATSRN